MSRWMVMMESLGCRGHGTFAVVLSSRLGLKMQRATVKREAVIAIMSVVRMGVVTRYSMPLA